MFLSLSHSSLIRLHSVLLELSETESCSLLILITLYSSQHDLDRDCRIVDRHFGGSQESLQFGTFRVHDISGETARAWDSSAQVRTLGG